MDTTTGGRPWRPFPGFDKPGKEPGAGEAPCSAHTPRLANPSTLSASLLAAVLALGLALVPLGAEESLLVTFRLAPPEAVLVDAGAASVVNIVPTRAADNGSRVARLAKGLNNLVVVAEGYAPQRLVVQVDASGPVIEAKMERAGAALTLSAMVLTGKRPKSVFFTPDGRHLVVAPLSGQRLTVLDASSGAVVAEPAPPLEWARHQGFVEAVFPPGRNEFWVSQMYTDRIHVFSLTDFSYLRTVPSGGSFPKVLLAHPDGRVFVSNWLSRTVSVLSPDGELRLGRMSVAGIPRGLSLSPDGSTLYVANFESGTIELFDAYSYTRTKVLFDGTKGLPAGGNKRHLVIDPRRNRLYASDMGRGSVFVYDLATETLLAELVLGRTLKTNTIALSPDGRWLYASTRGPNNPVDYEQKGPAFGELVVIDTDNLRVSERHWGGNQPTGLAVSPDGRAVVFTDFLDHRLEIYRRDSPRPVWTGARPAR